MTNAIRGNPLRRNELLLHIGMATLLMILSMGAWYLRYQVSLGVEALAADRMECIDLCSSEAELRSTVERAKETQANLEQEYQTVLKQIPTKLVDSEILSSIRSVAQACHCTLVDFRPNSTQKLKDFRSRSFDLHLEGRFSSLFQFFESLHRMPFAYHVGRLKISEPATPGGACRIDLELRIAFDHVWTQS